MAIAIIGVVLLTAAFGFFLIGHLLKLYYDENIKKYRLGLVGLTLLIIFFLAAFVVPLYMHLQE